MQGIYQGPTVTFYFGKQHDVTKIRKGLEKYLYTMNLLGIPNATFEGRDMFIPKMDIGGYRVAGMDSIEKELDSEIRLRASGIESEKPKLEMYLKPGDKKIRKNLESRFYAMEVLKIPCKMVDSNWDGDDFPELRNNGYIVAGLDDIEHSLHETMKYYMDSSKNRPKVEA